MNVFSTKYLLALALSLFPVFLQSQPASSSPSLFPVSTPPKHEVRAVWLTTIGGLDWPHSYAQSPHSIRQQQRELCQTLDRLQRAHVNTVLLQTRVRATTIYPSRLEPWDGCLSGHPGVSPGYDALRFAIDECHRRGMELHAWVVTIPVGKWNAAGCAQLRKTHPALLKRLGAEGYMDPGNPQTADYLARICEELVGQYDLDGIHLDYIRYPENWQPKVQKDLGRRHITHIVRTVSRRVKALKPWVKMSCSPIGKRDDLSRYSSRGWNAYTTVCQDVHAWLQEGLLDEIFPMMYFRGNHFYPFAIDWGEQACGRIVCPGLGIYFLSPREQDWPLDDITRELYVLRQLGMGHCYFRSRFLTDNVKGIYSFMRDRFDAYPALVPPMTWAGAQAPAAPEDLQAARGPQTCQLTWHAPRNGQEPSGLFYNVYASASYPVDTQDARNLLAARLQSTSLTVPTGNRLFYAVTAMNRYGLESAPAESEPSATALPATPLLPCDGEQVRMEGVDSSCDVHYLAIETLQGSLVATGIPRDGRLDVGSLPEGMYQLRSLNRKGVAHRVGFFLVRRLP